MVVLKDWSWVQMFNLENLPDKVGRQVGNRTLGSILLRLPEVRTDRMALFIHRTG